MIGVVGIFSEVARDHDPSLSRTLQGLADIAAIAILQERAVRRGEVLTEQLQGALNGRIVIEQAKGALAQIHGISIDEAFTMLRDHVGRHRLRLVDTAEALLNHPETVPDLTRSVT